MRAGILITPTVFDPDVAQGFEHAVALAKLAEEEGFSSAWIWETHFSAQQPNPVPLVLGGALAAETSGIRIGVMVKLALEHPVKIAEDAAVLDLMTGGRLMFGADPGGSQGEFAGYGVPVAARRGRFEEGLVIILKAWTGDAFAYLGDHHTLPRLTRAVAADGPYVPEPYHPPYVDPWHRAGDPFDYLSVLPKPAQIPHPPVFVNVVDEDTVLFAAHKGYSPVLGGDLSDDDVAARANGFWKALKICGRERAEVCLTVVRNIRIDAKDGSDHVLHTLKQLQQEIGFGQVLCRFDLPGLDDDQVERSLRLFAAEVRPRLEM